MLGAPTHLERLI